MPLRSLGLETQRELLVSVLLSVGLANAQESYPIMELVAQKVIEKYQTSSCQ